MSFTLIPVVALLLVILLNPTPKTIPTITQEKKEAGPNKVLNVEKFGKDEDAEYSTIFSYITSVYKNVEKDDAEQISRHLVDYGKKNKLDPKFAAAVIARESGFNRKAVSRTGAKGLGQIKDFNYKSLEITDPYDIQQNVSGTVSYLKRMLSKWKTDGNKVTLALGSYYKGAGAVKRAEGKLDKPTTGYVTDILNIYKNIQDVGKKYTKTSDEKN